MGLPITGSLEKRRDNAINLPHGTLCRLSIVFRQSRPFPLEMESAFIPWIIAVLIEDR